MKLQELKSNFINVLNGLYPSEETQSFFRILSEEYLSLSRLDISLNPNKDVSRENADRFQEALFRLQKYEPIQYIIGETEFYDLRFRVNEHTLIPRPETEELVAWILSGEDSSAPVKVLDIGTGSGCIAISLAKNLPHAKVDAVDISSEALEIAQQNSLMNRVEVVFHQTDILRTTTLPSESFQNDEKYDVIVSNPPYVRELEKTQMQPNVLEYEPASALFVKNEDPLLFYKKIARLAKDFLAPEGKLFFEINEQFGEELKTFLKEEEFQKIEVKQDIYGKDRMLKCLLK